jgi:hypothetical protein
MADNPEDSAAEWATPGGDDDNASTRILNQDEIDSLLGFDASVEDDADKAGIRAIINSALVSYERCRCSRWCSTALCV